MDRTRLQANLAQVPANPAGRCSNATTRVLVTSTVAGLLMGPLDLLAQTTLPYPWANLANSGAVWALAAFVLGITVRPVAMSAATGLVLLPVAVESYYIAGVIFRHDSTATLSSGAAGLWLGLGVIVGPLFGLAGGAVRSPRVAIRATAAALAGSVFLVEALVVLSRSRAGSGSDHSGQTAAIEIALALIVPLVTLASSRNRG